MSLRTCSKMQADVTCKIKTTKSKKTQGLSEYIKSNEQNPFLILGYLKTLVTENHNSVFNKGFYLRQVI